MFLYVTMFVGMRKKAKKTPSIPTTIGIPRVQHDNGMLIYQTTGISIPEQIRIAYAAYQATHPAVKDVTNLSPIK